MVRIDVRFDDLLSSTVNLIIYAEYQNILEIISGLISSMYLITTSRFRLNEFIFI